MADFSAPSFSLGLDLDIDALEEGEEEDDDDDERQEEPQTVVEPPKFELFGDQDEGEVDPSKTLDHNPNLDPPPLLKRLRRGPPSSPPRPPSPKSNTPTDYGGGGGGNHASEVFSCLDDEIEEFSSQEDRPHRDGCLPFESHNILSSSKISLIKNKVILTSQSTSKLSAPKTLPTPGTSNSAVLEESSKTKLLPRLTISPVRKIHLVDSDSDSDDPFSKEGLENSKELSPTAKRKLPTWRNGNNQKETELLPNKQDCTKKNASLATPALDEFCEEYYNSVKDAKAARSKDESITLCASRVSDPNDFFTDFEGRYQQKGKSRENDGGKEQYEAENLNYMSQFGARESSGGSWMNTRKKASIPTDAAKRRVHAYGEKSSGHWFTGQDGRKVYVSKNGNELTGQVAYRQYRKDTGAGYRKSRKKTTAKKKRKR
uniref:Uncharacterized protein n=1 Tax=Ananas comosus var. bracteatus TaxID=296719 RepID=A0A6V7QVL7_ANACO